VAIIKTCVTRPLIKTQLNRKSFLAIEEVASKKLSLTIKREVDFDNGNNTIVGTLSSIDHDCVLGDNSQVTTGVTFGGNVTAGENCFFGKKSAVIPKVNIGDNTIIMAGSVVYKSIPENVMVGGNPVRLIKKM